MTKAEQFFYDKAGYSYTPGTETPEQGRENGAKRLALAERFARANGWTYQWVPDDDDCGDGDSTPEVREGCILRDADGKVLESLWGIGDASAGYRRVVEAELALDHMEPEDFETYVPAGDIPMVARGIQSTARGGAR